MQPLKIFTIKRAIIKIKHIENDKIAVMDESNTIRFFNLNDLKLAGGFKINLPRNRVFANGVDVSKDGKYLALSIAKKNKASIWSTKTKKLLHLVGWHKGEIECVAFDNKNRYLATGGTDGRAHLWNIETGKMVGSLAPHADYVTSIGFSKNSVWCATGSYDKSISITNISSMRFAYKLRVHSAMVSKIKFFNNFKMISGDKEGNLVVSDYSKGKVIKRLPKLPDMVVDFVISNTEKYLFATTKNKNIFLYDLEKYDLITDKFLQVNSTITSLEFIPELMYLIIGTVDGILYIYDLLSDEKELNNFIEEKKYNEAYNLIDENPILKNSLYYSQLEEIWEKAFSQAQSLLEKGQKETAEHILKPFMSVSAKRMLIQSLFKDFAEFDKFKTLVLKQKYPLAYSIANRYPIFKQTKYYKHMEQDFKKAFAIARQLMYDKTKEDYIKKILMPFRGVPEKTPLIQSLATEKEIYKLLKQKLAKKDFTGFFELINKYPFLADLDEYQKAIDFAEKLKQTANNFLLKGNYAKVLQYTQMLEQFPMFKEDAKKLEYEAKILANFMQLVANKDYDKVYSFVKQEPFLEENQVFLNLEKQWEEKIVEAEKFSSIGDIEHILSNLKHYMKIKDKLPKIGELIKAAYLYQILSKLKQENNKNEDIERGFRNYIKIFGLDMEISDLIDMAKKAGYNIKLDNLEEGNKFTWYKKHLPSNIFE